jgi:hypothetical protein
MPKIFCSFWRGCKIFGGGVLKEKKLCDPEPVVYNFGGFVLLRAAMEGWARSKICLLILYCYILGFLGNMTYAPLHFHSNVTVLLHNNGFVAVTQQFKRKHYYGYGGVI